MSLTTETETAIKPHLARLNQWLSDQQAQIVKAWLRVEEELTPYLEALGVVGSDAPEPYAWPSYGRLIVTAEETLRAFADRWRRYLHERQGAFLEEGQNIGAELWIAQGGEPRRAGDTPFLDAEWDVYFARAVSAGLLGILQNTQRVEAGVVAGGLAGARETLERVLRVAHDYEMAAVRHGVAQAGRGSTLYQRVATLDERTCMACIMLDGMLYRSEDEFDDHPYGRCILVPLYSDTRPIRPVGGGANWFLALPKETQRAIMGPEYYAAWMAGKFDLSDLIKWLATGYAVVRALHELTNEDEEE